MGNLSNHQGWRLSAGTPPETRNVHSFSNRFPTHPSGCRLVLRFDLPAHLAGRRVGSRCPMPPGTFHRVCQPHLLMRRRFPPFPTPGFRKPTGRAPRKYLSVFPHQYRWEPCPAPDELGLTSPFRAVKCCSSGKPPIQQ